MPGILLKLRTSGINVTKPSIKCQSTQNLLYQELSRPCAALQMYGVLQTTFHCHWALGRLKRGFLYVVRYFQLGYYWRSLILPLHLTGHHQLSNTPHLDTTTKTSKKTVLCCLRQRWASFCCPLLRTHKRTLLDPLVADLVW